MPSQPPSPELLALEKRYVAATTHEERIAIEREMFRLTEDLDECPEGWHQPCWCQTCQSYGDG